MKYTCTVTIGRNIGDEPMSLTTWETFRDEVENVVTSFTTTEDRFTMDATTTHGRYGKTVEESATWIFSADDFNIVNNIRPLLGQLARNYSQECIALVIGQTDRVKAW